MTEITITTGVRSRLRELAANKAKTQTMDPGELRIIRLNSRLVFFTANNKRPATNRRTPGSPPPELPYHRGKV
jgi:hypothetical protein